MLDEVCRLRCCDQFMVDARGSLHNHRLRFHIHTARPRAIIWDLCRLGAARVSGFRRRLPAIRTPNRTEEHEAIYQECDPEFECGGHTFAILQAFRGPSGCAPEVALNQLPASHSWSLMGDLTHPGPTVHPTRSDTPHSANRPRVIRVTSMPARCYSNLGLPPENLFARGRGI